MSILIMKFGGTSVGSAAAIIQAADIISGQARTTKGVVVVVSAMSGTTDALTHAVLTAAAGDGDAYHIICNELHNRHMNVVDELIHEPKLRTDLIATIENEVSEFRALCASVCVLGEATSRVRDAAVARGERLSAGILAALLRQEGYGSEATDARDLIITDASFQNATPVMNTTRERIRARLAPLLAAGTVPVVTGFIAATADGETTTLGRGGSDYTAAILGDGLDADAVWIFTDVDGVMTADPSTVPTARVIPVVSYAEVGELAYFGANVLHPRTIRPVIESGIPLWVKNTFAPHLAGTRIVEQSENTHGTVKAVTVIKDLSMVTVAGRGMIGVPGIAGRTFDAVAREKTSVLMISQASSEQSICFVIPTERAAAVVHTLEEEMARELARRDIDRIWAMDDIVIVTAVGAGMRGTPGISARLFGALGRAGINVIAIAQGSSECSISLVVNATDGTAAVRGIHKEVIL